MNESTRFSAPDFAITSTAKLNEEDIPKEFVTLVAEFAFYHNERYEEMFLDVDALINGEELPESSLHPSFSGFRAWLESALGQDIRIIIVRA